MAYSIALLLVVLLAAGALVLLTSAYLMAQAMLHPPRMTDGKAVYVLKRLSPGDLGLPFSEKRFVVRDSAHPTGPPIELAAWWIPAGAQRGKCVVFIHGYADAKVGSIAWAPTWHALGFHILAIDLRAHGESTGRESTAGFFERHDLNELLDRLRAAQPDDTRELILFGISMGAAVAIATAVMRDDLAAVVVDSPFADYRTAIRKHLDRVGLPAGITSRVAVFFAGLISGARFAAVGPVDLLRDVPCPVMLIRGEKEDLLTDAEFDELDAAMGDRAKRFRDAILIVPGAGHLGALHADPQRYAQSLEEFLQRHGRA